MVRKFAWDPAQWRFRAEEARTVADQMTHEEARTVMRPGSMTTEINATDRRALGKHVVAIERAAPLGLDLRLTEAAYVSPIGSDRARV